MCDFEQIKPMIETDFSKVIRKTSQSRKALTLALTYLDQPELDLRTAALTEVDRLFKRMKSNSLEDITMRCAQARILNVPFTLPRLEVIQAPTVRKRFGILATAWMEWAAGKSPHDLLESAPKSSTEFGGALQWMSLDPWAAAIAALGNEDVSEARRLFRRSVQLGTQCQTESNPVVQWAYAASFFHP
jgi:hypothetical protein